MVIVAIRDGGVDAEAIAGSKAALIGRCCRLRGGLYGGGGSADPLRPVNIYQYEDGTVLSPIASVWNCRGRSGGAGTGVGEDAHSWGLYGCIALPGVCAELICEEAMDKADIGVFNCVL